MATRLGDTALDGAMAFLRLCILEAKALGDEFNPQSWDWLGKCIESDVMQYEIARLGECPKMRELSNELLPAYFGAVWPEWREDNEAMDARQMLADNPLFADEILEAVA